MNFKKLLKVACLFAIILTSGYAFSADHVSASEPPASFTTTDGLLNDQGVNMQFWFDFTRSGYDRSTGKVTYRVTSRYYFSANGGLSTDELYVNGSYVGSFTSHNGSVGSGYGNRTESFTVTLYEGDNSIKTTGIDGTGGNTAKTVHIPKFREYTVTFVDHDGTQLKKQTVESSDSDYCATPPSNPTRTGYHFTGWDKTYCNMTSNITVTAQYSVNKYKVKYNGNTSTSGSMTNSDYVYDIAKKLTKNAYSKKGYHFNAWNTKSDGTGSSYIDEQSVKNLTSTNGGVVNLYAQWLPNTYTIKYNANGGTGSMTSSVHTYDKSKALTTNAFTRTGWKFMGWNTKANGTGTSYTNKQSVKSLTSTNGATINLYAQWNQQPSIIAGNKSYYEDEISAYDWITKKRMQGVSASDREDGDLTNKVIVTADNVDTSKAGSYTVTYQVTDNVSQTVTKDATITIKKNNPPVITAQDRSFYENEITHAQWKSLRMKDVTASDSEDGNLTSKIEIIKDDVNVKQHGTYEVTYRVTDKYGKSATKTVKITVKENSAPLINAKDHMYWLGEITQADWLDTLRMADVTASDVEDGDLTSDVEIKLDEVKATAAGIYRVIYQVVDQFGKIAEKMINVEIRYNNKPIITAQNMVIHENEYNNDTLLELLKSNATAYDPEDGDVTKDIEIIIMHIDPEKAGTYTVIYRVTDSLGEITTKAIDVTVLENHAPRLQLFAPSKRFIEGEYSQEEWEDELRMSGVSAHDHEDHDLTNEIEVIEDTTIANEAGIYQVTYKVTDSLGKSVTVQSRVTVEPNEAPMIFANDKYFKTSDTITEKDLLKSVYASDDHDGDLTKRIKIVSNNVVVGEVGTYTVTYEVVDRFGKKGTKTVNIYIEESGSTPSKPSDPIPSDPTALGLWNGRQLAEISLTKLMEQSEVSIDPSAYKDVIFGIYSAEDIFYKGEVVLPKDSMIGISHIDENGNINVRIYHEGKYYAQELSTNENYQLDTNKYYFEFMYEQTGGK